MPAKGHNQVSSQKNLIYALQTKPRTQAKVSISQQLYETLQECSFSKINKNEFVWNYISCFYLDQLISEIKVKLKNQFIKSGDILITRERHRYNLEQCVSHLENFKRPVLLSLTIPCYNFKSNKKLYGT